MEKKKLVKRDYFNALAKMIADTGFSTENITNEEFAKFVANELNLLAKKNVSKDGEKKLTDKQKENIAFAADIVAVMSAEPNRLFTITELTKCVPSVAKAGLLTQRVSPIVKNLVTDGIVERVEDKRKPMFRIKKQS